MIIIKISLKFISFICTILIISSSYFAYSNNELFINNKPLYYDSYNKVYICNQKPGSSILINFRNYQNVNTLLVGNKEEGYTYEFKCLNKNSNNIILNKKSCSKVFNNIGTTHLINIYPMNLLQNGYVNNNAISIAWFSENQIKDIKRRALQLSVNKGKIYKSIKLFMVKGKYYLKINCKDMDTFGIMISKGKERFCYKLDNKSKGIVEPIAAPYGSGLYKLTITFFVSFYKLPISIEMPIYQKTNSVEKEDKYILETENIRIHNCLITQTLAQIISANDDNYTKTLKIYKWITSNIAYDTNTLLGRTNDEQSYYAIGTLVNTKGVCEGYANLFSSFCRASGIPCKTIYGKLREGTNWVDHAWNSVYINKRWINVDTTFGAGYIKDNKFIKHPSPLYFDVPDNEFFTTRTKYSEE